MKYTIEILTTITLITIFAFSGCDKSSNEMEDAETSNIESTQNLEIASSDVNEEIRVYRLENADRFKEFNRTTSEIEKQIENESDRDVRDRHETKLEEHKETQQDLNREIDNYQVSESDNWNEFKDNFSDKMDDLDDSLDDFFSTENTNTSSIN